MPIKILRYVLLAFVVTAVVVLVGRAVGGATGPAGTVEDAGVPSSPAQAKLVAFYFHGSKRCASCNSIERLTREALKAEVDAGAIEIRSVNLDEPAQAHYTTDFQLSMRTVVLAEETGGTVGRWQRLDECWDRFGDPEDFRFYIQRSLARFRVPPAEAP